MALLPSVGLGLLNGLYGPPLARTYPTWYWLSDALQFLVVPVCIAVALFKVDGLRPADYGFRRFGSNDGHWRFLKTAGLVTFLYWLSYEPVKYLAQTYFGQLAGNALFVDALPETQPLHFIFVFYACATAALVEEPVFRSIPWLYFLKEYSSPVTPYVLTTSTLFAAIHWEQGVPGMLAAGTLGVVAAVLYTRIQNVWPFVVAHFVSGIWSYRWL